MNNDKPFVKIGKRMIKISSIASIELADDSDYDFEKRVEVEYQLVKIHFEPETPFLYVKSTEIEYPEALVVYNYINDNLVLDLAPKAIEHKENI